MGVLQPGAELDLVEGTARRTGELEVEELEATGRSRRRSWAGETVAMPSRPTFVSIGLDILQSGSADAGSRNIDDLFRELVTLSRALSDEQQRHVREQLSEEELTVFDLLTRPGPELSTEEREEVKKVARRLLEKVKAAVVLDWRQKSQARARVRLTIEDTLDEGLPRAYTPELFEQKVAVVFEHVYDSYQGEGRSVYTRVA